MNDKVTYKRSFNHSERLENTQDETIKTILGQSMDAQNKTNKRRIIVPVRRTHVIPSPTRASSTNATTTSNESDETKSSETSNEQKKKIFVKRRRIGSKPSIQPTITQHEKLIPTPELHQKDDSPEVSLELITREKPAQRTYTYVVTRVHDGQSEMISSTLVRNHIEKITETITHTIQKTSMNIRPTVTLRRKTGIKTIKH